MSSPFAGALSLALCYCNRAQALESAAGLRVRPRVLCLQGSQDNPTDYISMMNAIFGAQRQSIPIDAFALGEHDSPFLQQAAHITRGAYAKPARRRTPPIPSLHRRSRPSQSKIPQTPRRARRRFSRVVFLSQASSQRRLRVLRLSLHFLRTTRRGVRAAPTFPTPPSTLRRPWRRPRRDVILTAPSQRVVTIITRTSRGAGRRPRARAKYLEKRRYERPFTMCAPSRGARPRETHSRRARALHEIFDARSRARRRRNIARGGESSSFVVD